MNVRLYFNLFLRWFGVFCLLYYVGMGLAVTFRQSLLFLWPVVGGLCLLRSFWAAPYIRQGLPLPVAPWLLWTVRVLILLWVAFFLFVEVFVVTGAGKRAHDGLDAVIVLGAKVNGTQPSGALHERIEAAADYLLSNPDTLCIASGGQGEDEGISEAECIRRGLVARGVEESRILLEERSTSTVENMLYSLPMLPEGTDKVGLVTSDFHMFRTLWTARQMTDLTLSGIPGRSSNFGFLHYAMREFCAIVVGVLQGELHLSAL